MRQRGDSLGPCFSRFSSNDDAPIHSFTSVRRMLYEGDTGTVESLLMLLHWGCYLCCQQRQLYILHHATLEGRPIVLCETVCIHGCPSALRAGALCHTRCLGQGVKVCRLIIFCMYEQCNIIPMYVGSGVSCATLCLTEVDDVVPRVRLCLTLLNFSIWAAVIAAGLVSSAWSLMLGPSRIILTSASSNGGTDSS